MLESEWATQSPFEGFLLDEKAHRSRNAARTVCNEHANCTVVGRRNAVACNGRALLNLVYAFSLIDDRVEEREEGGLQGSECPTCTMLLDVAR